MTGPGKMLEGRYEIGPQLGRTDAGAKYEGLDHQARAPVIVFLLQSEASQRRMVHEGTVVSSLRSPNTVRLLSFGRTESGAPYVVTEAFRGETLTEYQRRVGKVHPDEALAISQQALQSLAEAHAEGIAHGALTPDRIVDANGIIKIEGYGFYPPLVEGTEGNLSTGETFRDDHRYAAPEMFDGTNYFSPVTDIFAVGVIARELMLGRGVSRQAGAGHIPPDVSRWIDTLLAEDPAYRPRDAAQALSLLGLKPAPRNISDHASAPSFQSAELELDMSVLEEVRGRGHGEVHRSGQAAPHPQGATEAPGAEEPKDLPPLKRGFDLRGMMEELAGTAILLVGFVVFLIICAIALISPFVIDALTRMN